MVCMKISHCSLDWKKQKSEIICFYMKTPFIGFGMGWGRDLRDDQTAGMDSGSCLVRYGKEVQIWGRE